MIESDPKIKEIFDLLAEPSQTDLPGGRGDNQRGQIEKDDQGRTFFKRRGGYQAGIEKTVVPDLLSVSTLTKSDYLILLGSVFQVDNKDEIITALKPKFISQHCFEFTAKGDGNPYGQLYSRVERWPEDEGWGGGFDAERRSVPWDFSKEYLLFFLIIFVKHHTGLVKLYQSEIRPDEFGSPDTTSWQRKLNKFLEREVFKDSYFYTNGYDSASENWSWKFLLKCLRQGKDAKETGRSGKTINDSFNFVKNVCDFFLQTSAKSVEYGLSFGGQRLEDPTLSSKAKGIAFENYCIALLEGRGWSCDPTPKSGDQGADIVASRGPIKLVIQCKDYKGSVGNDSVQQIIAAKTYYNAQIAAVLTNSKYTSSAKSLAESTGVLLLFESDLHEI